MSVPFTIETRVDTYLARQIQQENLMLARRQVDPATRFVHQKLRELYWTVTRLFGLGHLHDGTRGRAARRKARPLLTRDQAARHAAILRAPSRLLIDVTATYRYGGKTGIQRVVREIARRASRCGDALPVIVENGDIVPYGAHPTLPASIDIRAGDKYLLLDGCWGMADEYPPIVRKLEKTGARLITAVYDLIPLMYPLCADPDVIPAFRQWFETFVMQSDAVICISRSVAMDVAASLKRQTTGGRLDASVGWCRLGADFTDEADGHVAAAAASLADGAPYFLSVGTLEPRKGYPVAIDAFTALWDAGVDARYVIVGRKGWQVEALEAQIMTHPEFGRRLFWLKDASDADLSHCYAHARGLVYPSLAEGFGLPLAEAGCYGLPVIASDLPVFREIAGDYARYFRSMDSAALATAIMETLRGPLRHEKMPASDWDAATSGLIDLIMRDAYQLPASPPALQESART